MPVRTIPVPGGDRQGPTGPDEPPHLDHERGHVGREEHSEDTHDSVKGAGPKPGRCRVAFPERGVGEPQVRGSLPRQCQQRLGEVEAKHTS
jgi:hypothetical protein